ncbi:hypothetical protein CZ771_00270 [Actinomycetales bacterium JB111]|nr:hypothetical protein CZ771_00270 [Actinomycetales bacterium JB111]
MGRGEHADPSVFRTRRRWAWACVTDGDPEGSGERPPCARSDSTRAVGLARPSDEVREVHAHVGSVWGVRGGGRQISPRVIGAPLARRGGAGHGDDTERPRCR